MNPNKVPHAFKSHLTLTLWRMNQGDLPHSIASLDVMSESRTFTILQDRCFVSHDRSYIFIVTVSETGLLEDLILAYSDFLEQPQISEIDLYSLKIK